MSHQLDSHDWIYRENVYLTEWKVFSSLSSVWSDFDYVLAKRSARKSPAKKASPKKKAAPKKIAKGGKKKAGKRSAKKKWSMHQRAVQDTDKGPYDDDDMTILQ